MSIILSCPKLLQNLLNDVKQENLSGEEASNPIQQTEPESLLLSQTFPKLYESSELGNSFLTKYTQLLSSFHQHQQQQHQNQASQQQQHYSQQQAQVEDDATPASFTSLIPTTVQEHQISPSPKDAKVTESLLDVTGWTSPRKKSFKGSVKHWCFQF